MRQEIVEIITAVNISDRPALSRLGFNKLFPVGIVSLILTTCAREPFLGSFESKEGLLVNPNWWQEDQSVVMNFSSNGNITRIDLLQPDTLRFFENENETTVISGRDTRGNENNYVVVTYNDSVFLVLDNLLLEPENPDPSGAVKESTFKFPGKANFVIRYTGDPEKNVKADGSVYTKFMVATLVSIDESVSPFIPGDTKHYPIGRTFEEIIIFGKEREESEFHEVDY